MIESEFNKDLAKHTITRAWRIRVYPNRTQQRLLARTLGACRWLKTHTLDLRSSAYEHYKIRLTGADFSAMLTGWKKTPGHEWLTEIPSTCFTQALRDQDAAFSNFFAGRAKYPKRPRRGNRESVRFQDVSASKWADGILSLPKIGALRCAEALPEITHTVKPRKPREDGKKPEPVAGPAMVTLTREPSGEYYVSFTAEAEVKAMPSTGKVVGVDLGIKTLATLSTGEKKEYHSKLRAKQRYLKRCQRAHARTQKGSKRRERARKKLAKAHQKIADYRNNTLHELTTELVTKNDIICIEDLSVKGLARGFLAAHVQDAAFGEFRRQLTYKCQWYGKQLIVVNRYFPSSKTCSVCGAVNKELRLRTREWCCHTCGTRHDRDVNAAQSIEAEGLRILRSAQLNQLQSPGGESLGNGRQDTRGRNGSVPLPVVLVNEASIGTRALACMEQAIARE